ncbi:MAG: tetratricopeptide repeat protein, partial [Chloroflexota bacterium]
MSFILVALALGLFLLPGYLLAGRLLPKESWIERLPAAMLLSMGLLSLPGLVVMVAHLNLLTFFWAYVALIVILTAGLVWSAQRTRAANPLSIVHPLIRFPSAAAQERLIGQIRNLPYVLPLLLGGAILFVLSARMPLVTDDWVAMPWLWHFQTADHVLTESLYHGIELPTNPREEFGVWALFMALVQFFSRLPPVTFYATLRPFVVLLALISFFDLSRRLWHSRRAAAFTTSLWVLILLATATPGGGGYDLLERILQDKFVLRFLALPLALGYLYDYLKDEGGRMKDEREKNSSFIIHHSSLFLFGAVSWAAGALHPSGPVMLALPAATLGGLCWLYRRDRQTLRRLVIVGLLLAVGAILPAIQYLMTDESFVAFSVGGELVDPKFVDRVRLATRAYRLWFLDNGDYILHPAVFWRPEFWLAALALPIIALKQRMSRRQPVFLRLCLLVGPLVLIPPLLYLPATAALLGAAVTPWLLWRLAWPAHLSAWLILTGALYLNDERGLMNDGRKKRSSLIIHHSSFIILFLVVAVLAPTFRQNYLFLRDFQADPKSECRRPAPVLEYLAGQVRSNTIVLGDREANFCIPAYSPWLKVVEYRGVSTLSRFPAEQRDVALQRLRDVDTFAAAEFVDDEFNRVLTRYEVEYILIEDDRLLNLQLAHWPAWFTLVYEANGYNLYAVASERPDSVMAAGNSALLEHDWATAEAQYSTCPLPSASQRLALHLPPATCHSDDTFLSLLGLSQAAVEQGRLDEGLHRLQQAVALAPDEALAQVLLADTYLAAGELAAAISAYERAVTRQPDMPSLLEKLADAYHFAGRTDEAITLYQQAAALREPAGLNEYYVALGQSYNRVGLYEAAVTAFQQASASLPTSTAPWLTLGNVYLAEGELEQAEAAYQTAL